MEVHKHSVSHVVLTLVLVLIATPVFADEPHGADEEHIEDASDADDVAPEDLERAQDYFDQGAEQFYAGNYSRAAVEFRRAHEIYPHPVFLYNFAVVSNRLERLDDALEAAQEVRAMDERLPPEQDAQNSAITVAIPAIFTAEESALRVAEQRDVDAPPEVDDAGFGVLGWAGLAALAVGTGTFVAGGVTHLGIRSDRVELEDRQERNPNAPALEEFEAQIESSETNRNILYISGLGLMSAGAALAIVETRRSSSDSADGGVAVSVSIAPTATGITLRW